MNFTGEFNSGEEQEERTLETPVSGDAKLPSQKWFIDPSLCNSDEEELLKCLRCKAEYLYFIKDYAEASKTYERYLQLLPETNVTSRMECMEHLARSLLHQRLPDKALEWALKMHAAAVNPSQKLISWNLLATVCHTLGKYEEELEALHCCLESHKSNPDFWLRLAYCYSGMFGINIPSSGCEKGVLRHCCDFQCRTLISDSCVDSCGIKRKECIDSNNTVSENCSSKIESANHVLDKNSENQLSSQSTSQNVEKCEMCILGTQIISACLIRTSVLVNNCDRSTLSQTKSSWLNEKVSACLAHMEVEQPFIDEASAMLKSEIFGQQNVQDSPSSDASCSPDNQVKSNDTDLIAHNMQSMSL